jgi:hypothetical protein
MIRKLRLPRVDHRASYAPESYGEQEPRERRSHPEQEIDPPGACHEQGSFDQDQRPQGNGCEQIRPTVTKSSQEACKRKHGREGRGPAACT